MILVPIIKATIGAAAKHIRYYSNIKDDSIPTVNHGVSNAGRGGCQRFHEITKRGAADEWKHIKWLVIIDDDTIMRFVEPLANCRL